MKRILVAVLGILFIIGPNPVNASSATSTTQKQMSKLQWRSVGPFIGGRVVAVTGVPSQPNLFYMGGVDGGVWKSTNYGREMGATSPTARLPGTRNSIGAIAVAPSNPKIIYVGTGESDIRGDFDHRRRDLQDHRRG